MQQNNSSWFIHTVSNQNPTAYANISGSIDNPDLTGTVYLYTVPGGTLFTVDVRGLPYRYSINASSFFGFHIHEGSSCGSHDHESHAEIGGHYDPGRTHHPEHAGDLPPLLGNFGWAWSSFVTERFTVDEVLGRVVIIHSVSDNFTAQPFGDAGAMVGCGEIKPFD